MRLATIGFAVIIAVTLVMMYDSMAETIIMPDGTIIQCTTDSTGITVCI
jgi:nitrogen fixation protein FixH